MRIGLNRCALNYFSIQPEPLRPQHQHLHPVVPNNQYTGQESQEWHDCQPVKRSVFNAPHSIGQKMSPAIAPVA